jgi:PAS domain S-box-containing protein
MLEAENERLRGRVGELERQLSEAGRAGGGAQARLTELLHMKNRQLEADAEELARQAKEADRIARELAARNEELINSMAALRLYQLMFENDPHGLIGVAPDGVIVQFNSSAIRFFGYDLHRLRMENVSGLELPGTEVGMAGLFAAAMKDGEAEPVDCEQSGRRVRVSCFRLEDIRGCRGVVFRLSDLRNE